MSDGNGNKKAKVLLEQRFPARARVLCQTRSAVRDCLVNDGCQSVAVEDVVLAIDEACQNIIRHAYCGETDQEILLHITRHESQLEIHLRDFAPTVSADCMKPRALDDIRPGGLGSHLIQEIMDDVSIAPSPNGPGNVMRMTKWVKRDP
ncbi:MAG: ATP-binding protein [Nitrospirota bacterium]|nr:ATP-binding protein [Nitrospirota bacterium]